MKIKFEISNEIDELVSASVEKYIESGILNALEAVELTSVVYNAAFKALARIERQRKLQGA